MGFFRIHRTQRLIPLGGFTIIELIMVLVILAIIGVLVMRPVSYLSQIRETAASRKLKADIRYAQSYALSSQARTRVAFDIGAAAYSFYYESSPGVWTVMTDPLTKGNFTVNIGAAEFAGVSMSQKNFDGVSKDLVFDAAGKPYSCDGGGASITALVNQGGITFGGGTAVHVEPVTGKVQ